MATIPEALALAVQHHQAGRLQEAEAIYQQILRVQPEHPDCLHLLGVIAQQVGRHDVAVGYITRAIALNPEAAEYHNNIGEAYRAQGRTSEAEAHYQRALALKPDYADARNNLGLLLQSHGRREDAIAHYRLGLCLQNQGKGEDAIAHYQQALRLNPSFADAHCNIGVVLTEWGRLEEAIAHYRKALALKPTFAEAHNNLGSALKDQVKLDEAMTCLRQALALKPDYAEAYNNLGIVLRDQGKLKEAIRSYQQALAVRPDDARIHSNLLLSMCYLALDGEAIAQEHRKWNERHVLPRAELIKAHANTRDPERRLRVGYVSADFRSHSVSFFLEPLLAAHDHANVEVFCYSNGIGADATTERLRARADVWRNIAGSSDDDVAEIIRADGVDILVDLSGHTAGNRLLVFARKPAPVQVSYLGYPKTTGVLTIDYLLTDRFMVPPGSPEWFSENLIRLPGCCFCYAPPVDAPPVAPLPADTNGYVTFASFNNLAKVNPAVVRLWADILRSMPDSRLLLKDRILADLTQRTRYLDLFKKCGIAPQRLDLLPRVPTYDHLATYGRVDIGLDPFPYGGHTTTCQALWMGVPVVTLAGTMACSRYGVSLLSNLELGDLIATTPEAYVQKAVMLANDRKRLAALRAELRPRMAASVLCDAKAFAQGVEQAYRSMWRKWCHG